MSLFFSHSYDDIDIRVISVITQELGRGVTALPSCGQVDNCSPSDRC